MHNHNNRLDITHSNFGLLKSEQQTQLYTLTNTQGTSIKITNYGGIIVAISTADNQNNYTDIVLGYDTVAGYENDPYYLGAVVGRYAGRIDQGLLTIEKKAYQLDLNAPDSQLHSGINALNKQLWQATTQQHEKSISLILEYTCPDGTNGFPGDVDFCVKYTLNNNNAFDIEYFAKTNKNTIVNLTQHSYFNLSGHDQGSIVNHQVTINADHFLPMDERAYPTGEIKAVQGTVHDFTQSKRVGNDIDSDDQQVIIGKGYDNYWLLNQDSINKKAPAAQLIDPKSGRRMTVYSDQPAIILYTANYIDGSQIGKNKFCYQARAGLCLETLRAYNHSFNKEETPFQRVLLTPAEPFYSKTSLVFDVIDE
ncbi:MAG: aldose 1-epimerase [Alteromonadaceae bacterium]|jgi:aldose 1-epimerase